MSAIDLVQLQVLAEAAALMNPGQWQAAVQRGKTPLVGRGRAPDAKCVAVFGAGGEAGRSAARYVGALGPDVVLSLIEEVRQSKIQIERRRPTPERWDSWPQETREALMTLIVEGLIDSPEECTCRSWCGEASGAGCPFCWLRDIYLPCPVLGFGCGMGAADGADPCDCCEPEQWAAASGSPEPRAQATGTEVVV